MRKKLKQRREELGYTRKSFSNKIGVSFYTYRNIEQGINFPGKTLRTKIMNELSIFTLSIFDDEK